MSKRLHLAPSSSLFHNYSQSSCSVPKFQGLVKSWPRQHRSSKAAGCNDFCKTLAAFNLAWNWFHDLTPATICRGNVQCMFWRAYVRLALVKSNVPPIRCPAWSCQTKPSLAVSKLGNHSSRWVLPYPKGNSLKQWIKQESESKTSVCVYSFPNTSKQVSIVYHLYRVRPFYGHSWGCILDRMGTE